MENSEKTFEELTTGAVTSLVTVILVLPVLPDASIAITVIV